MCTAFSRQPSKSKNFVGEIVSLSLNKTYFTMCINTTTTTSNTFLYIVHTYTEFAAISVLRRQFVSLPLKLLKDRTTVVTQTQAIVGGSLVRMRSWRALCTTLEYGVNLLHVF